MADPPSAPEPPSAPQPPSAPEPPSASEALAALDRLLADRPDRVTHDFSAATRALTDYRAALLRAGILAGRPALLGRLNAVISVVYGTHYPVTTPKWESLEQARAALAELAASV